MMSMVFTSLLMWVDTLPATVRALGAVITIAGTVSGVTLYAASYHGLPAQVEENTEAIHEMRRLQSEATVGIERVLCLIKLQMQLPPGVAMLPLDVERACLE